MKLALIQKLEYGSTYVLTTQFISFAWEEVTAT